MKQIGVGVHFTTIPCVVCRNAMRSLSDPVQVWMSQGHLLANAPSSILILEWQRSRQFLLPTLFITHKLDTVSRSI
eukprot:SAG31_NODE_453_length_15464_cov_37.074064_11_plen_76_part_00